MKKIFSIICLFLFFSACSSKELGEARIVQVYDLKEGSNKSHQWRTVIQCLESNGRHILDGKVGDVGDVYMSVHC